MSYMQDFQVDFDPNAQAAPAGGYDMGAQTTGFFPSSFEAPPQPGVDASPSPAYNQRIGAGLNDLDDEPPLLEELEISFPAIWEQTKAVLNPFRPALNAQPATALDGVQDLDTPPTAIAGIAPTEDTFGPFCYIALLGFALLLAGKSRFGYIFGLSTVSIVALYCVLNMMAPKGATVSHIFSTIGYCILPLTICSFVALPFRAWLLPKAILAILALAWGTLSASRMFVENLGMIDQRPLVAYPVAMIYFCFALLVMF